MPDHILDEQEGTPAVPAEDPQPVQASVNPADIFVEYFNTINPAVQGHNSTNKIDQQQYKLRAMDVALKLTEQVVYITAQKGTPA